jgi:hypothetical protein
MHGRKRDAYRILVRTREGKRLLGRPMQNGKIILKWILKNRIRGCGLDSLSSVQGPVAGACKHVNEPSGSIN